MPDQQQMMKRQQVLADFGDFALHSDDLDEVLTEACRLVSQALGTSRAKVLEILEDRNELLVRAGVGWGPDVVGQARLSMSELSSETFSIRAAKPVLCTNIEKEDRFEIPEFLRGSGVVAFVNVPIFVPGRKAYGLLEVDADVPQAFGEDEIAFLRTYATILGPVIDRCLKARMLDVTEERYRELFERIDEGFCIINVIFDGDKAVDYRFVEVNPAFEHHTDIPDAQGRTMREIAPDHEELWFEQYGEVALTGEGKRFEAPAKHLGNRWYDLNAFRVGEPHQHLVAIVFSDITQRRRDAAALRESEERFAQFAASSSDGLWIRDAATLDMEYASPAIEAIYGVPPEAILGNIERWITHIVEEDRETARSHLEQARDGAAVTHEFRIRRPSDGELRWIRNTDFPLRDDHGRVQRIGGLAEDATEARELRERQGVLVAELQHRTRNLLGVVRAMADKAMRRSADLADFQVRFGARLSALARVQGLLSRLAEGERITFDELIHAETTALNGSSDRITLAGPRGVALRSSTVQTFALALHELATNAAKYGAFAQPQGRLDISWRLERSERDGRPWLHVDWHERSVVMPVENADATDGGSGRELIERALPYQLGAKTTYVMGADGVRCTIALPVSERQLARDMADA